MGGQPAASRTRQEAKTKSRSQSRYEFAAYSKNENFTLNIIIHHENNKSFSENLGRKNNGDCFEKSPGKLFWVKYLGNPPRLHKSDIHARALEVDPKLVHPVLNITMDGPQDDLKWFGEGFDGFPKKLPDDVVEYMVFIIDSRLSDIQTRERLQAFQRALNSMEKKFLKEYIWQRDSLKLDLVREEQQWLLRGRTNYGDSVADEWLIVFFLRELSKEFKDAWIRVYDSDGEFLLIEAANALPKWLNPEVAENRVWINCHRLLIIPLGKEEEPRPLTQAQALQIINDTPGRPQQYVKVEKEAFHRLSGYPAAISENQHHATVPLPRKAAHILHMNPSYIAPVVEAFYLRDPISMRLLQPSKTKEPLMFPPEDFVDVSVRFTKVLYAQLLGQHWEPPAPWDTALEHLAQAGKPIEKAEIGIKIAAGMQMLLSYPIYSSSKSTREIALLLEDLDTGDDTLATDTEIASWPKREDDEGWLSIDFAEFERELEGKGSGAKDGFGDKNAQENLKKMVARFNDFLADNEAGAEGADGMPDPMDIDDDSDAENRGWDDPEDSDSPPETETETKGEQKAGPKKTTKKADSDDSEADSNNNNDDDDAEADAEYAEYEKAYEKFMMLPMKHAPSPLNKTPKRRKTTRSRNSAR
ncbi:regulatory factor sgt1 [Pyrenophora seminiperda CCB06]|uniref:Regulatory factor sgt1 n=1 Tax=Pyrenophora seminiperda CCB06 TaxID=1302712 RepID=A0A3M7M8A2_9PLEO|nr:regulatory factor sgt1 [Pyrenophora seminiperda CCB06]